MLSLGNVKSNESFLICPVFCRISVDIKRPALFGGNRGDNGFARFQTLYAESGIAVTDSFRVYL